MFTNVNDIDINTVTLMKGMIIFMKKRVIVLLSILFLSSMACSKITTEEIITVSTTDTSSDITTNQVIFDYLDQTLPTNVISRFLLNQANISWFWNGPPVFSPDGEEVYWSKIYSNWEESEIWYKTNTDGIWSSERKLTIDGLSGFLSCPVFVGNSNELYFKHLSPQMEISIMKVTRIDNEWSNPETLNIPIPNEYTLDGRFSIAENNNIYFTLLSKSGMEHMKIYYSEYSNGQYGTPQAIDVLNGSTYGSGSPFIAKDESFILFDSGPSSSYGVQDIYVSFKDEFGHFMNPINLGRQINSIEEENSVIISEDGQYLFFLSKREDDVFYTPYWIRLDEIDLFR